MADGATEVTRTEFYAGIYHGNMNVHPRIEGMFPYVSRFLFPNEAEYGRVVDQYTDGKHPIVSRYFVENRYLQYVKDACTQKPSIAKSTPDAPSPTA